MLGVSIDNEPDSPVGTPETRRTIALHWHWTTEYTNKEIASALGVREETVEKYLRSTPAEEVREQLADVQSEVRYVAVQELKHQLKAAGHRSRTAETPVKVWRNGDGDLVVQDQRDDAGKLTGRYPIPVDYEIGADEKVRYYAREEVRDILDLLTDIVGAKSPEEHKLEHTGAGGGPLQIEVTNNIVETDGGE